MHAVAQKKTLIYNPVLHSIAKSPGIMILDLKKDFGAVGTGITVLTENNTSTVDHKAFENAADFINSRGGYVTLNIPNGIYIVGKQLFSKGQINHYEKFGAGEYTSYDGFDVFLLLKCKKVTVKGETSRYGGKPVIRYRNNLKIGLFNNTNGAPSATQRATKNSNLYIDKTQRQRSNPGDCFKILNCDSFVLMNIIIDGNVASFNFGGKYGKGENPYENYHSGIYLANVTSSIVSGITVKNMALDGIVVKDIYETNFSNNISILNCIVTKNGRNGFSWLSGTGITITSCEFSAMGTGAVSTEPCAGIDIEPETLIEKNWPSKGVFKKCIIKENRWLGLAAGVGHLNGTFLRSSNMLFDSCTFIGSKNSIADIESDGYRFTNCSLYGLLYLRNRSDINEFATSFTNCRFSNIYKSKKMKGGFLVVNNAAKRSKFYGCNFTSYSSRVFIMDNTGFECGDYNSYPLFESCIFKNYTDTIKDDWVKTSGLGSKTSFKNNIFYYNKSYPFLTDTYSGNMCAQDLGGNKYYILSKKEILLNKIRE